MCHEGSFVLLFELTLGIRGNGTNSLVLLCRFVSYKDAPSSGFEAAFLPSLTVPRHKSDRFGHLGRGEGVGDIHKATSAEFPWCGTRGLVQVLGLKTI